MLGKKLINAGPVGSSGPTPSNYFNTVLYTGNGGTQRIGGYINRGAVFNDNSSKITASNPIVSDTTFSISVWVNLDNVNTWNHIASVYNSTAASRKFILRGSQVNALQFITYDESGNTAGNALKTNALTAGTWHHVVAVADGGDLEIYLDNSSVATNTGNSNPNTDPTENLSIGSRGDFGNTNENFGGKIDQVRIFNKALSSGEVTTLYGETHASTTKSTTDIFDDNSGVALYQLDGNANDTGGVSGYIGEGAIFNGSSSYITINSTSTTPFDASAENFTVSAWINVSTFQNDATIISKWGANSSVQSYQLGFQGSGNNTKLVLYEKNGSSSGASLHNSSTVLTAGQWYHIGLVRNSTQVIFYINGSAETISATNSINDGGSQSIIVGRQDGYSTTSFNGKLDQVRIYDKALSSSEVTTLYGETASSNITISDLVAYYPMEGDSLDAEGSYNGTDTNVEYNYSGTATNVTYQDATNFSPDLVWIKSRSAAYSNRLFDSVRGATKRIMSNSTDAQATSLDELTAFDSNGFTLSNGIGVNQSSATYAAWCFNAGTDAAVSGTSSQATNVTLKANPDAGFSIIKFTTSASTAQPPPMNYISHGLTAAPEMVIYKLLTSAQSWVVQHDGLTTNGAIHLDLTNAQSGPFTYDFFDNDATNIGVRSNYAISRDDPYIAYAFHSVDGIQKVGSYTGTGVAGNSVVTGFEPAFVMVKRTDSASGWLIIDNKRGNGHELYPHSNSAELSSAEGGTYDRLHLEANGFTFTGSGFNESGSTWIYLAIAADPDTTTPTVEDSFQVVTYTGTGSTQSIDTGFKPDLIWFKDRGGTYSHALYNSINGRDKFLRSNNTDSLRTGASATQDLVSFDTNGFTLGTDYHTVNNANGRNYVAWCFKAGDHDDNLPQINTEGTIDSVVSVNDAAGFSIVKYTGTGALATIGHGLSSAPELIFIKNISSSSNNWAVAGGILGSTQTLYLNLTNQIESYSDPLIVNTQTSTTFTIGADSNRNGSGAGHIAYCFTSITGYQSVGSYTGNGSTTGPIVTTGFRPKFIIAKPSTAADNWSIWDNVREVGDDIDQILVANNTGAESAHGFGRYDITLSSTGFQIKQTDGQINANGVTYIYLAIK